MTMDNFLAGFEWWIIAIIGLALIFLAGKIGFGLSKKGWQGVGAIIVGAGLIFGASAPLATLWPAGTTTGAVDYVTFNVEPAIVITNIWDSAAGDVITTQGLDATETVFTVPLNINEVASTSYEFVTNFTAMNFTVTPIPPPGATQDDLATIYFATDYNIKEGGEWVFVTDGNEDVFFANWTRVGTVGDAPSWDHNGQDTMLFTEDEIYQVAYKFDSGINDFCEEMATVGNTVSWSITFANAATNPTWTKTFTVNAVTVVSA